MARATRSVIDVVEVAYRSALREPGRWVERVLEAAEPFLDLGSGVVAYEYDTNRPMSQWLSRAVGDARLVQQVHATFPETPPELNELVHRRAGAVTILSELIPRPVSRSAGVGPRAKEMAMADMFGVNASDPSGRGTYFCAPSKYRLESADPRLRRWQEVAAHVAAAGRLRRVLARATLPEAILSPEGQVMHVSPPAEASIPVLQRAVRAIARARSTRSQPDALTAWRALLEGRWSFVDEVERDGRRILLAHPNAPEVADPRRLSPLEATIAGFVAMGHPNKLIAYELGLAQSTVALHLRAIARMLGVRSRVAIVDRFVCIAGGETRHIQIDGEHLAADRPRDGDAGRGSAHVTPAEVAEMARRFAARGESSAAIARERRVSARTIANQLASVYAKLSVGSRSELARRLANLQRIAPASRDDVAGRVR